MQKIKVESDQGRIDQYLAKELELSRSGVQELIKNEKILVNDKVVKMSYKLKENDEITIVELEVPKEYTIEAEDIPLDIRYEDADIIVINKPSGLVVHPGAGNPNGTLVNALMYHIKTLSDLNTAERPGIVHRIDKDTSGLLMVAKNNKTHESLAEQLKEHTTTREYIALVEGVIEVEAGLIDAPIGRDENNRLKMGVTSHNSKQAITEFEVIKFFKEHTLVKCKLQTGRTHQIRVHFNFIGHPIVGDPLYGKKKTIDVEGQALHAAKLGFIHPTTNEYLEFVAELPARFEEVLRQLSEGEDARD